MFLPTFFFSSSGISPRRRTFILGLSRGVCSRLRLFHMPSGPPQLNLSRLTRCVERLQELGYGPPVVLSSKRYNAGDPFAPGSRLAYIKLPRGRLYYHRCMPAGLLSLQRGIPNPQRLFSGWAATQNFMREITTGKATGITARKGC